MHGLSTADDRDPFILHLQRAASRDFAVSLFPAAAAAAYVCYLNGRRVEGEDSELPFFSFLKAFRSRSVWLDRPPRPTREEEL